MSSKTKILKVAAGGLASSAKSSVNKSKLISGILNTFNDSVVSGPGLNLVASAQRELLSGSANTAESLLKRAALNGKFAKGEFESVELAALRSLTQGIKKKEAMPMKDYSAISANSRSIPLLLNKNNFPTRMSSQGFVPLTDININKPGLTLKQASGKIGDRFTDEGATNLIAAWNMDPQAAAKYSEFYPRVNKALNETGIPMDRVSGAWAVLSSGAKPERNAELLEQIARNPSVLYTTKENQELALMFLAGLIDDPAKVLGRGKRFNFDMNSLFPDDPRYLTGDTRYAQNVQGILNAYGKSEFAGLFDPFGRRYEEIYVRPGIEAARRMGIIPNRLQAGTWGNWRNKMSGISEDVSDNILSGMKDFPYNENIYKKAIKKLSL